MSPSVAGEVLGQAGEERAGLVQAVQKGVQWKEPFAKWFIAVSSM